MSDNAPWGGQPDQPPAGQPRPGDQGFGAPLPRYPNPGGGQPPPGYGQAPPPGSGQPPPYGAPGYGTPGYGQWPAQPPAPAPGGVPLRPLGAGDILSGAFTLIRRNPVATLGLAAIVQTIYGVCGAFISWTELNAAHRLRTSLPAQPTSAQVSHALGQFFSTFGPYALLNIGLVFVFQAVLTGMLTGALGRGLLGSKVSIGEAWRIARVPSVIAVSMLVTLLLIALWIPVAAIVIALAAANAFGAAAAVAVIGSLATFVVTVWISIRLALAVPAIVLEKVGPTAAMRRSWQLVQGSWWRVFGIWLLAWIVVVLIGLVLQIPFAIARSAVGAGGGGLASMFGSTAAAAPTVLSIAIGAIGSIIAATCTRPISAGVTVLLYTDMRIRKEGLDLALHQASQRQGLTGDEFSSLWRPGQQGPGQFPGTGPGMGGAGWYPGQGQGGAGWYPGQGQGGAGW